MTKCENDRAGVNENMRPPAAAKYLDISLSHLNKLRMKKNRARGPAYSVIAGCVIYTRANLDKWRDDNAVDSAA